ncbi:hypothetical protein EIP91_005980 [Steccherinum ochraceum]|uniref:Uncharacterized protein n=1 Tax=Steccherinum ochraceum TaxID=92696 RepID=A0A4R0RH91_9APHY|nr:hypothetical protein EIP91_005980 [Steccherinum ochraceum]
MYKFDLAAFILLSIAGCALARPLDVTTVPDGVSLPVDRNAVETRGDGGDSTFSVYRRGFTPDAPIDGLGTHGYTPRGFTPRGFTPDAPIDDLDIRGLTPDVVVNARGFTPRGFTPDAPIDARSFTPRVFTPSEPTDALDTRGFTPDVGVDAIGVRGFTPSPPTGAGTTRLVHRQDCIQDDVVDGCGEPNIFIYVYVALFVQ